MNNNLKSIINLATLDSLGIYPVAIHNQDGTITIRTPWQDGWNAAILELRLRLAKVESWIETLSPETQDIICQFLDKSILFLRVKNDKINLELNCNDIFYPAADSEECKVEDLQLIFDLYTKYSYDGIDAWVYSKRTKAGEEMPYPRKWRGEMISLEFVDALKMIEV